MINSGIICLAEKHPALTLAATKLATQKEWKTPCSFLFVGKTDFYSDNVPNSFQIPARLRDIITGYL
jgi:hypothetical protein